MPDGIRTMAFLLCYSRTSFLETENVDGAAATVTGLQIGTSQFRPTMRDNEGLSSTTTLSVTVKAGRLVPPLCERIVICTLIRFGDEIAIINIIIHALAYVLYLVVLYFSLVIYFSQSFLFMCFLPYFLFIFTNVACSILSILPGSYLNHFVLPFAFLEIIRKGLCRVPSYRSQFGSDLLFFRNSVS